MVLLDIVSFPLITTLVSDVNVTRDDLCSIDFDSYRLSEVIVQADDTYLSPASPDRHRGYRGTVKRSEDAAYFPAISISDFRVTRRLTIASLHNGKDKFVKCLSEVTAMWWKEHETNVVHRCRYLELVVRVSCESITYQDDGCLWIAKLLSVLCAPWPEHPLIPLVDDTAVREPCGAEVEHAVTINPNRVGHEIFRKTLHRCHDVRHKSLPSQSNSRKEGHCRVEFFLWDVLYLAPS